MVSVELDVVREYALSELEKVAGPEQFEPLADGVTKVVGLIEESDSQGLLILRVGGTFLTFDVRDWIPTESAGTTVRVLVDDLQLHPTGI